MGILTRESETSKPAKSKSEWPGEAGNQVVQTIRSDEQVPINFVPGHPVVVVKWHLFGETVGSPRCLSRCPKD